MKSNKKNIRNKNNSKFHRKVIVSNRVVMGFLLVAFSITLLSLFTGALRLGNFGYFTGAATSALEEKDLLISQNEQVLSLKNGFEHPVKIILYLDSEVSDRCLSHLWIASQDTEKNSCLSGLTGNYVPLENYGADTGIVVCDYLNYEDHSDEINVFFRADSPEGLEKNCQAGIRLVAESIG